MKRFRKVLLALTALLGILIVGGIWLVHSALNVASDAVDSAIGGAQKLQMVAQREVVSVAQSAKNDGKAIVSHAEASLDAPETSTNAAEEHASTGSLVSKTPEQHATTETKQFEPKTASTSTKPAAQNASKEDGDDFADVQELLSLVLNDGEEAADIPNVLKPGSDQDSTTKTGDKNEDDSLTALIPGANSPTVQKWMSGKYKGKESQALDDALEDPKIWRLVFFLSGGM